MSQFLSAFRHAQLPPAAEAFRAQVRAFLQAHQPAAEPARRARSWMGFDADFSRRLAAQGWVGVTLPRAYGGAELDAFSRFVLVEELLAAGAPVAAHWIADRQSGPLIHRFGSEAQKAFYLPRICRGEAFFGIGMSEPNAGSDLASVGTRASPTGDGGWRLNGRKVWTTHGHRCDYLIVLCRTSGEPADRQKGLSQLIVDLRAPGVTVRPIDDLTGDAHFCEIFFDDVALPADALVGREGDGWKQVNAELAFERSGPERIYSSIVLLDTWAEALRRSAQAQRHAALLGRLVTHLAVLRRMSIAVTARLAAGETPLVEAALVKDLGTTFEQEIPAAIAGLLAEDPAAPVEHALLDAAAYLTLVAPTFSLRGGTREILRGMIARGLGLR
jgi:alkylation response protein AidB-like acyl-CoA dehydrogenase